MIGDSNLHAFGRQAGRLSDGKDYISGRISAAVRGSPLSAEAKTIWEQILARPQTDISSIDALSRILQSVGELAPLVTVKHAAEVRGADLQGSNVVIVGEPLSNP